MITHDEEAISMNKNTNNRLFLLDAYALIFRAYYAFIRNPVFNSKGQNTSAIFGFIATLEDLLNRENPTHLAVVFDPPGGSFRNKLYPEYKANREETPEEIIKAVPYIKKIIEAYRIPIIEIPQFEADDVIGTLAIKARERGFITYMMTPDKDFAQLVSENIFMYKPARSGNEPEIWGVNEVRNNFGIDQPEQVKDILALWGDASDNIPGCPGIGEVTSRKLIRQFKSIDGVFENISSLKGKQRESIEQSVETIRLSKILATIRIDVPVDIEPDKLKMDPPDWEALKALFDELEFKTMTARVLTRVNKQTPSPVPDPDISSEKQTVTEPALFTVEEKFANITTSTHHYRMTGDAKSLNILADKLNHLDSFAFDTETTDIDTRKAELVCITISFNPSEAFFIPVPPSHAEAVSWLAPLKIAFENRKVRKIGQNMKFDILMLEKYGIRVEGPLFDTMLAHYLIQPELRHNLDFLAETYLGYRMIPIEELIGEKGKNQKTMRDVDQEKVLLYACEDADITLRLSGILRDELEKYGMTALANEVEMPLIRVLCDMETAGVKINTDILEQYALVLKEEIRVKEQAIYRMAGIEFNISSPKQLGQVLFEKLGVVSNAAKTKTGQYSTGEDVLADLIDKHEIIPEIIEHRSLAKLLSTYVVALPRLIDLNTKRIHTSFNQAVTATGRLSSNNPNLQNIPIREERGREIRKAFVSTGDNHFLLSADYSQIELRIMAHMSGDKEMIAAFRNNEDIHTATASKIFGVDAKEVSREMRSKAKTANFGIIYGISAFGLAQRLKLSRQEAKELIDGYFRTYPDVKAYMDQCIAAARQKGYVETILGRRRYLPNINSRNAVERGFAERNAINAPIQGSAADIIKIAMVNIHRKLTESGLNAKMILQVHDELVFEVHEKELGQVKAMVINEMQTAVSLRVPLVAEAGTGKNWLDAHF